jgi:pSer/pThr/pTyr-binding forkhead associated (FHA) protein
MAELVIFSGKMKGQKLILPDREVIIGRDDGCQMRIASSLISRKHCSLRGTPGGGVWVRDLESQNGTYVNDVAITEPYLMKPGDILRVGAALFQVPRQRPQQPKPQKEEGGGLSDDEISTWLADEEQTESSSVPDTTVIKGRQTPAIESSTPTTAPTVRTAPTAQASAGSAPLPPDGRTVPTIRQPAKTVKEQAAEIIQRHLEIVRSRQSE